MDIIRTNLYYNQVSTFIPHLLSKSSLLTHIIRAFI